jgi:hypothetical protein
MIAVYTGRCFLAVRLRLAWLLAMGLSGCSGDAALGQWLERLTPRRPVAQSETDQVPESSGVVASRVNADLFWTHNDSGRYPPRVYAFRLSAEDRRRGIARDLGYVELAGATLVDWEDIAAGPDDTIYVFDGGDNPPCKRSDKRIYRFREPKIDPNGPPAALEVPAQSIRFEYPSRDDPDQPAGKKSERYDAECLLVHPATGDMHVITKRDTEKKAVARVYGLSAARLDWDSDRIHVLRFVGDIGDRIPAMVTGGDLHPDGRRVVIRTYTTAYEFQLPDGQPFEAIFEQRPRTYSLLGEPQGEAICYTLDGDALVTTAEVRHLGLQQFPIYLIPREERLRD